MTIPFLTSILRALNSFYMKRVTSQCYHVLFKGTPPLFIVEGRLRGILSIHYDVHFSYGKRGLLENQENAPKQKFNFRG